MRRLTALTLVIMLAATAAAQNPADDLDVLIRGGTVHDGTGAEGRIVDVGIKGDRIVVVGNLIEKKAKKVIDARGLIVCPGFIDLHNHGDQPILREGLRKNLCYITQGCTTIVTGNCGSGHVDVKRFLGELGVKGCGSNVAHLLPQGSIRRQAMGGSFKRKPTEAELKEMLRRVDVGMKAGAWGMTTGLIYTPGTYATTDEIAKLAEVVGKHGGIYASHIRSEADKLVEAVEEAIEIGRRGGCPVHISHFKASKPPNWGKVKQSCAAVEKAREAGHRVTVDQYPYRASSTSLAAFVIPTWAREGTNADLIKRIDDAEVGPKIRTAIAQAFEQRGGADQILVAYHRPHEEWSGLSVEDIAKKTGKTPVEVVIDIQRGGGASAVGFSMCDEDVEYIMKHEWVATASDGSSKQAGPSRPHPRSYGTFPRKIGHYAIEKGIVTLEDAIRSSTSLPADILGLTDRGRIAVGQYADVVVFDPKRFRDKATFVDPHRHSEGAVWVFVNGEAALAEGKPTGALAGRPLKKTQQRSSR